MKQVNRIMMIVALFLTVGIPQSVKAQEQDYNNKVFDVAEQMPSFPGGMGSLMSWLSQNIRYPVIAAENGIQGRVIVQLVVEKDGSITDVKVAKSVDPSLDKEAARVVSAMPKWTPGKENGFAVRVKYTVPVTFNLYEEKQLSPYEKEFAQERSQLSGSSSGVQSVLESCKKYAIKNRSKYTAANIALGYERGGSIASLLKMDMVQNVISYRMMTLQWYGIRNV